MRYIKDHSMLFWLVISLTLPLASCQKGPGEFTEKQAFLHAYESNETIQKKQCQGDLCFDIHLETSHFIVAKEQSNDQLPDCGSLEKRQEALEEILQFTLRMSATDLPTELAQKGVSKEKYLQTLALNETHFSLNNDSEACLLVHEEPMSGIAPFRQFVLRFTKPTGSDLVLHVNAPFSAPVDFTFEPDLIHSLPKLQPKCLEL